MDQQNYQQGTQYRKFQLFNLLEGGTKRDVNNPSADDDNSNDDFIRPSRASRLSRVSRGFLMPSPGIFYTLKDVEHGEFSFFSGFIYLSCIIRNMPDDAPKEAKESINTPKLLKIFNNTILGDYDIHNKSILKYKLNNFKNSPVLFSFGLDIVGLNEKKEIQIETNDSENIIQISFVKIFDMSTATGFGEKSQPSLIRLIPIYEDADNNNLIVNNFSLEKNPIVMPYEDISEIAISKDCNFLSLGCENGNIIIIYSTKTTLAEREDKNNIKHRILKTKTNRMITNLMFSKLGEKDILYISTHNNFFYTEINKSRGDELIQIDIDGGIDRYCLDFNNFNNNLIIAPYKKHSVAIYNNFKLVDEWHFEGKINMLCIYQNSIAFAMSLKTSNYFIVFDTDTQIYSEFIDLKKPILSIFSDQKSIFVCVMDTKTNDVIINRYGEMNTIEKFEVFYKKKFYDTAYKMASVLTYPPNELAEIAKKHAIFLYEKGDFEGSIEKYKMTINYIEPSEVIINFLDASKLPQLISYLEALRVDETFKQNTPSSEMKNYIALLLNCYIKNQQIDELKSFIDQIDEKEKIMITKTSIDVCKETDKSELALFIAKKSNIPEFVVQVEIEFNSDYKSAMKYLIKNESNQYKIFEIFSKYGEKCVEEAPQQAMELLMPLVNIMISSKNKQRQIKKEMEEAKAKEEAERKAKEEKEKEMKEKKFELIVKKKGEEEEIPKEIKEIPKEKPKPKPIENKENVKEDTQRPSNQSLSKDSLGINDYYVSELASIPYETILSFFVNKESSGFLKPLLNTIMVQDNECPPIIIHRMIELFLEDLYEKEEIYSKPANRTEELSKQIEDIKKNIIRLIEHEKYKSIIDLNYSLLLFKMYNFKEGMLNICKRLNLTQELLQIFMDSNINLLGDETATEKAIDNFNKILEICEKYGYKEKSVWEQVLHYFLELNIKDFSDNKKIEDSIHNCLRIIVEKIQQNYLLSPLKILQIFKEYNSKIKYDIIQKYLVSFIKSQSTMYNDDKKNYIASEDKFKKLCQEETALKTQSKMITNLKCTICNEKLRTPYFFFKCGHSYHLACLSGELSDGVSEDHMECVRCADKEKKIKNMLYIYDKNGEEQETYFDGIDQSKNRFEYTFDYLKKGIFNYPLEHNEITYSHRHIDKEEEERYREEEEEDQYENKYEYIEEEN
ncbi:MAG: hypothetical protein MJ252_16980, partial [archaeon]|nr:hypothetical protein [archaeon]